MADSCEPPSSSQSSTPAPLGPGPAPSPPHPGGGGPSPALIVLPERLDFYLLDRTTHKRIFTVYNPYEVDVRYKVLCNNPNSYSVVEPQGRIRGRRFVDVVVRHHYAEAETAAASKSSEKRPPKDQHGEEGGSGEVLRRDKFRILLMSTEEAEGGEEPLAKKDILASLHSGKSDASNEPHSHSLPQQQRNLLQRDYQYLEQHPPSSLRPYPAQPASPNWVVCLAGVVCIMALLLPTEGDLERQEASAGKKTGDQGDGVRSSSLAWLLRDYTWLHLSVNMKLAFAFVLGLVTTAVLRPAT